MTNILLYGILLLMTIIGAVASFFLKKASSEESFLGMLKRKYIYIGGILYLLSAVLNVILLRFLDYSIVLPLTSITYIWTLFISFYYLKEKINKSKILAIMLIVLGAILITI